MIMDAYDRFIIGYVFWDGKHAGENFYRLVDKCVAMYGLPEIFHTDRGPEFISNEIYRRGKKYGFRMSHSRPFKLTDNGRMERFYRTMKKENKYFRNQDVPEAKARLISWLSDYNWKRYHSVIEGHLLKKEID